MNPPTISEADLLPHLPALSALVAKGWQPCINILDTQWHVGLHHASLPKPELVISGCKATSNWDGSPLTIHARSRSLFTALDQAIAQAEQTDPS